MIGNICRYTATVTSGHKIFMIEPCNTDVLNCHTLSHLNNTNMGEDLAIPSPSGSDSVDKPVRTRAGDNTTTATYSIFFYYTPEFAAATPDIDTFIDHVLAETNEAYVKSQVPLVATRFCAEQATINDDSCLLYTSPSPRDS